jgi:hypothetical protein
MNWGRAPTTEIIFTGNPFRYIPARDLLLQGITCQGLKIRRRYNETLLFPRLLYPLNRSRDYSEDRFFKFPSSWHVTLTLEEHAGYCLQE